VVAIEVRRASPKAISFVGSTEAVRMLESHLTVDDFQLRYQMARSLNRLRNRNSSLKFDRDLARAQFETETRKCYQLLLRRLAVKGPNGDRATTLLTRALEERYQLHLELAFRFAGLVHDPRDMLYAYTALAEKQTATTASAVEFLDTLWQRREKELMFPLLERDQAEQLTSAAQRHFSLTPPDLKATLSQLLQERDDWLAACAVHVAHTRGRTELQTDIEPLTEHAYPALREAAQSAVKDWA
jgi:hypothetical protein